MITATLNTKKVRKALNGVQKDLKRPRQFLNQVAKNETERAEQNVRVNKIDPDGRRWAPWAYSTLQERIRQGNVGRGLLYRSGSLLRSFYNVVRGMSVEIRNRQRYARFLQEGRSNMPRRQLLGWGRENKPMLEKGAKKFFGRKWK